MSTAPNDTLASYIDNPFGTLQMKGIRVGRVSIEEINITAREAAINTQEFFDTVLNKTRRVGSGKNGTRFPEPLPVATPARLLKVEIQDHLGDMERRCLARDTIDSTARTLKLLLLTCGNVPVSRIDHKHMYAMWDLLRWLPPGVTSSPDMMSRCCVDIIAEGKRLDVAPPAPATLEKHRRFLVSFFNQMVRTHAIPASPMSAFAQIKKDLVVDPNRPERLFDENDLQRIFDRERYVAWAAQHPHRWWAPMIGLYTGARINEVAQLKVADIVQEGGAWCIAIRKTVDADLTHNTRVRSRQSLKGLAAVRTIPIPQPLLQAGFLDFLADMRACGHPRLFPHLSAGVNKKTKQTNARYSQGLLSQFGGYLKTLGFGKGIGFHAFRHTFATELHHQGVPEEDIALVTGHSIKKKVPVLHEAYFHKKPAVARMKQTHVLESYKPTVNLPVYKRGQFKVALGPRAKFYP